MIEKTPQLSEFKNKWLKHVKKPNYSQKKIDELEKDLNQLIEYFFTLGQQHTPR